MITSYCLADCALAPQENHAEPMWIDVCSPTPEEAALLLEKYKIPLEYTRAATDKSERPRVEQDNGITLLVTRASQGEEPRRHLPFATCPLAIIVTPDVLVTVCNKPDLARCLLMRKLRGGIQYNPVRLALSLLMRMSATYIEHLHQIDEVTVRIEHSLRQSMENSELVRMLHIEKSLIYLVTSLRGNRAVLEKLQQGNMLALNKAEEGVLSDVMVENKQAMEMAEVFSQILGSLSDAFGSMVSNNLNKAMKFLTAMTIVLMIPTIIGGLYGMNVPLPFQETTYAFVVIIVASTLVCVGVWHWFKKKDWM